MSTCAWKAATNAQSKSHGETPHRSALKLHGPCASTRTCPVERIPLHLEQLCKDHRHHGDDDDDDDDDDDNDDDNDDDGETLAKAPTNSIQHERETEAKQIAYQTRTRISLTQAQRISAGPSR